jgi:uncharacterized membrane protein
MSSLFLLYFLGGILLILLAVPLMLEKVKPNAVYGFRVRATLEDPAAWYAVNKHFGRRLLIVGLLDCIASVLLYFVPGISVDAYALGMLAVFGVAFSIALLQSWKYMKSLEERPG